VITATKIRLG